MTFVSASGEVIMFGDIESRMADRWPRSANCQRFFGKLLSEYLTSGVSPPDALSTILRNDEQTLQAIIWEALLYRHFQNFGFKFLSVGVSKAGQNGPDFCLLTSDGRRIWIEATVPSPDGLPSEWLDETQEQTLEYPHEAMLLRWTNSVAKKRQQLAEHIRKGIILPGDAYWIAINSCRLSRFAGEDTGITQLPFAVEAVFPIGPIGGNINTRTMKGTQTRLSRFNIQKPNGAEVPLTAFVDPASCDVSGLIGFSGLRSLSCEIDLVGVHNPQALVATQKGLLNFHDEYTAVDVGSGYELSATHKLD